MIVQPERGREGHIFVREIFDRVGHGEDAVDRFRFTMNTEPLPESDRQKTSENNDYAPKQQAQITSAASSSTSNGGTLNDQPQRSDSTTNENPMTGLTPSERRERTWTLCIIALIALLTGLPSWHCNTKNNGRSLF